MPQVSNASDYISVAEAVGANGQFPWLNMDQLRWIIRHRKTNGFAKAFARIGERRILVHVPTFMGVLDARRGDQ